VGVAAGIVGAGGQIDLQIAGRAGVPVAGIAAVVLNVTATESVLPGYVSVFPAGTRRPTISNLNLESAGQTVANLVTVKVGTNGQVTLFASGGAQLIADITGYYTPAATSSDGRLQAVAPERILDTRQGLGAPLAKVPAHGQIEVQITGRGPVPSGGVSAVVLNVTGDQASGDGFVTVWPTGIERPVASNLNLVTDETRANLVVVPLGTDGSVSLFTSAGADLIADVAGWFTDASSTGGSAGLFVPTTPTRARHPPGATAPTAAPVLSRRSGDDDCATQSIDGRRLEHHRHRIGWSRLRHRMGLPASFVHWCRTSTPSVLARPSPTQRSCRSVPTTSSLFTNRGPN
jgi:hypothetical protein